MQDMTEEKKRNAAKIVQELQLYPYRPKLDSIFRYAVWITSWTIGIALQPALNSPSLGSAYLFFAVSMLMEFLPESRTHPGARVVHGIFCFLLFIMAIGALTLIFGFVNTTDASTGTTGTYIYTADTYPEKAELNLFCLNLSQALLYIGWAVCIWMFISVALALTEMHKVIYDSSAKSQQEDEHSRDFKREQFMNNLNGSTKVSQRPVSNITPKRGKS